MKENNIPAADPSKMILAVSFGTSYAQRRENAIGGIEKALAQAFPEYQVKRAFTSPRVIRHIQREEGILIDDPVQALEKAVQSKVRELVVCTTHVMDGIEYRRFMGILSQYQDRFERVVIAGPLIRRKDDLDGPITAVREVTAPLDDGNTAIVLVGHGTDDPADHIYVDLQKRMTELSMDHYLVGTIESEPSAEQIAGIAEEMGVSRIILMPFMVVAGEHAIVDLAGEKPDSWQSILSAKGYEVQVIQKGLGEFDRIRQLYVQHVREALALS